MNDRLFPCFSLLFALGLAGAASPARAGDPLGKDQPGFFSTLEKGPWTMEIVGLTKEIPYQSGSIEIEDMSGKQLADLKDKGDKFTFHGKTTYFVLYLEDPKNPNPHRKEFVLTDSNGFKVQMESVRRGSKDSFVWVHTVSGIKQEDWADFDKCFTLNTLAPGSIAVKTDQVPAYLKPILGGGARRR